MSCQTSYQHLSSPLFLLEHHTKSPSSSPQANPQSKLLSMASRQVAEPPSSSFSCQPRSINIKATFFYDPAPPALLRTGELGARSSLRVCFFIMKQPRMLVLMRPGQACLLALVLVCQGPEPHVRGCGTKTQSDHGEVRVDLCLGAFFQIFLVSGFQHSILEAIYSSLFICVQSFVQQKADTPRADLPSVMLKSQKSKWFQR